MVNFSGCTTTGETGAGLECVFPFKYKTIEYTACTSIGHKQPWCSTENHEDGNYKKWKSCDCPGIHAFEYFKDMILAVVSFGEYKLIWSLHASINKNETNIQTSNIFILNRVL
jgi:hypothetical protein